MNAEMANSMETAECDLLFCGTKCCCLTKSAVAGRVDYQTHGGGPRALSGGAAAPSSRSRGATPRRNLHISTPGALAYCGRTRDAMSLVVV